MSKLVRATGRSSALPIMAMLALSGIPSPAQSQSAVPAKPSLSGRWFVNVDFFGTAQYYKLELAQNGETLTGNFSGDKLEGTLRGNTVQFLAKDTTGGSESASATLASGTMSGTMVLIDGDNPQQPPSTHAFTATLVPPRIVKPPRRHDFTPTVFYRQFSAHNKPVLTVAPGDTIVTTTVDAGGTDAKGVSRVLGGNPQTGPFYVEGAVPGDTLVVHLGRVRLNRDWALSDDDIVPRGLDAGLAVKMKDTGAVRWHLDLAKGVATSEKPGAHLAQYSVPLRPMLGCVGVAPRPAAAAPPTQDSGNWGGNMDFNEIVEGATVYLPVSSPGALLYIGDAHAAQGDGELNGNALETSMDVQLTVDLIQDKSIPSPRVESATHIMAMGLDGSLDGAFRAATSNMAAWLTADYKLTASEVAQVLGTSAEYRVSEVADRNAGIVLKLSKERLRMLKGR